MDDAELLEVDDDYYAFLNLPRDATLEQINTAYKQLSRQFHPDKHIDPAKKKDAEMIFNRIKTAHAVLSSPEDRQIYDLLGTKGLRTDGLQLIPRKSSPSEIREEYERLAREKEERRLQQLTNPKGNITLHVNCTDIFNSYETDYDEPGMFSNIEIAGMTMFQSIEVPMSSNNVATLAGNLSVSNGQGNGRFTLSARKILSSKGWIEVDVGAGNGLNLGGKGTRNLGKRYFTTGQLNLNFRPNGIVPALVGTFAVQLDKHTVGYLTYSAAGMQSSLSTIIERNTERNYVNLTFSLGLPHSFISCNYIRRLIEQEMKLKLAGKVGTFGFMAEYGVEKKVSKYSSLHASVTFGVPTGVALKIRFIRSSQSYNFNIQLSEEIIPAALFYATTLPIISYFILKKCILEPLESEKQREVIEKKKEMYEERLQQRRKEAEAAISLMLAQYERICSEEEAKAGLVILHAFYGKFDDDEDNLEEMVADDRSSFIDVKIPLQCLVKDSNITVHTSLKYELPGFYDPAIGENKVLKVQFKYRNNLETVVIEEKDEIKLPLTK
ncbi:CLUMA_CG012095, isoform A [Clunio marinus]|uniref:CLUMA_CG012095, isoform A n=1 Tax=Clunio marinus TaxID=568069 RepID=A0A1J1IFX0_9DIPT|nr:CLUMA_CG012095, isoform A [Clunio marinus]